MKSLDLYGVRKWFGLLCVICAMTVCSDVVYGQLRTTSDEAQKTPEGVLRKAWVIRADTPLFRDTGKTSTFGVFPQNAKAYLFGEVGEDLYAVGNKPRREDCDPATGGFFGYVPRANVLIWDTDQALRFTGDGDEVTVAVFADEELSDKVADFGVRPTSDPTVEPFPIFRRTQDGKAFEIACVLAGEGETTAGNMALKMDPLSLVAVSSIDVAFVMDITGSMGAELEGVKQRVASLIREFSRETIDFQGRREPLRLRFAFVGYRDREADGDQWLEVVDFVNIGQEDDFQRYLDRFEAKGGGPIPESVFEALQRTLGDLSWNAANGKAIILIGDAPANDIHLMDDVVATLQSEFIPVYALTVRDDAEMIRQFRAVATGTEGNVFAIRSMASSTETVVNIVDAIKVMHSRASRQLADLGRLADAGGTMENMSAQLSRTVQEFKKRGIMPKWGERPLPSTVFVPSMETENVQVCIYKSKAALHDMLGGMQMDFISMARDATPETLLALQSGGLEMMAELSADALNSIINMEDLSSAQPQIQEMMRAMPGLPDLIKKIAEVNPADVAAWHALAEQTAGLSRFLADPKNFYNDHAWVPFDVMRVR